MKDKHGVECAKLSKLKAGDIVRLDGGFTCTKPGYVRLFQADDGLYFACKEGRHYLEGQADDGEHCVGVYSVG